MILALLVSYLVALVLTKLNVVNRSMFNNTYLEPVKDFFKRYGMNVSILLLAIIGLYRVSDIVLGVVANIFYQDMGFSKVEIAAASKTFGLFMTISGGFFGGILAIRIGIYKVFFRSITLSSYQSFICNTG